MSWLSIPDLAGATPSACARDLARSTELVRAVNESLTTLCDLARPAPTLLTASPLATLGWPPADDHQAVLSEPRRGRSTAPTPDPDARPPMRRRRRPLADCPPEPPTARAVREDPTCRVGGAQFRAVPAEFPQPAAAPVPRAVPPVGMGTPPAMPAWPWPASVLTDRLGIDVRPSLACPPRPGPAAPPHLLVHSSLARVRVTDDPALARVSTDQVRTTSADASPRFASLEGRSGGLEGSDARRHAGTPAPDDRLAEAARLAWPHFGTTEELDERRHTPTQAHDGGTGTSRTARPGGVGRPAAAGRLDGVDEEGRGAGRWSAPERTDEWGHAASSRAIDERGRDWLEAPDDARRAGSERPDDRPHAGTAPTHELRNAGTFATDDGAVEAAVERVLTDAARRYGIGV